MGIGQDKSLPEILSRRISLKAVRGTIEENYYCSSVCSTVARENEIQKAKMAIRCIGGHVATPYPRMVIPKADERNASSKTSNEGKCNTCLYAQ